MKSKIALAIVAAMVAGCAQNQMPGPQRSQPTTKDFPACDLRVQFSGQPQEMPSQFADEVLKDGAKLDGTAWLYASTRLGETRSEAAYCYCPDESKLEEVHQEVKRKSPFGRYVDALGHVQETPLFEGDQGQKVIVKSTLRDESKCILIQLVNGSAAPQVIRDEAVPFLGSLSALPKPPRKTGIFRTDGSAAQKLQQLEESPTGKYTVERLKLLDQLLKEKLITPEEFNTRRAKIIDNL